MFLSRLKYDNQPPATAGGTDIGSGIQEMTSFISPETKLSMVMMFVIAYIFSPGVFWLSLTYLLEAGAFPVEADSIGIPMGGFLLLWFVGWVLMILAAIALAIYRATFGTNLR
jgi:hypothetical protein